MHVRAEPGIVGKIPAWIIRIFVDHNGVGVPQPVGNVRIVGRRDAKVEAVEPEAVWPSAGKMENVAGAEAAAKVTVLPGAVEMIARLHPMICVADPFAVRVYMRCVRMTFRIAKIMLAAPRFVFVARWRRNRCLWTRFSCLRMSFIPCRSVGWNVAAANVRGCAMLLMASLFASALLRECSHAKS